MNTLQLKKDMMSRIFSVHENVYAADQLPTGKVSLPSSIIINLDTSDQQGSHWVCIHIDAQEKAEYFDSYGFPPANPSFIKYMQKNSKMWTYNTRSQQSYFSSVCGHYCIVYLYIRSQHYTLHDFLGLFSIDRDNNDNIIKYLYSKKFLEKNLKPVLESIVIKTPFVLPLLNNFLKHIKK